MPFADRRLHESIGADDSAGRSQQCVALADPEGAGIARHAQQRAACERRGAADGDAVRGARGGDFGRIDRTGRLGEIAGDDDRAGAVARRDRAARSKREARDGAVARQRAAVRDRDRGGKCAGEDEPAGIDERRAGEALIADGECARAGLHQLAVAAQRRRDGAIGGLVKGERAGIGDAAGQRRAGPG